MIASQSMSNSVFFKIFYSILTVTLEGVKNKEDKNIFVIPAQYFTYLVNTNVNKTFKEDL